MAHQIAKRADGEMAIAYTGETPWHRGGTRMLEDLPIDEWKRESGMDFTIESAPVQYTTEIAMFTKPRSRVLYRSDNYLPLAVVGSGFKVLQPGEVLDFFKGFAEAAGLQLHTAGVLFDGARYWALARVPEALRIDLDGDMVHPFLLLATACDGSMSNVAKWTAVRVVCNNTLGLSGAYSERRSASTVRVSHRSAFDADKVRQELGLNELSARWTAFREACEVLAQAKVETRFAQDFTRGLLRSRTRYEPIQKDKREPKGFDRIMALFEGEGMGAEASSSKGTKWGLLNAITQYADWEGGARTDDRRVNEALLGGMASLKERAMRELLAAV